MTTYERRLNAIRNKWRWMSGMGATSIEGEKHYIRVFLIEGRFISQLPIYYERADGYVPDITDPATQGCLMAQVREQRLTLVMMTE